MREGQDMGPQGDLPAAVRIFVVALIVDQRQSAGGELHADLMGTPGAQFNLHQGEAVLFLQHFIRQLAAVAVLLIGHRDHVLLAVLDQIVHQRAALLGGNALGHGVVDLAHLMGADGLAEPGGRLGGAGEDHRAADRPVQPVHKAEIDAARLAVFFLQILLAHALEVFIAAVVRHDRHIDRLFDAQQMVVFVEDLKHCAAIFRRCRRAEPDAGC